jgi:DnaJ-class molecular chaperone
MAGGAVMKQRKRSERIEEARSILGLPDSATMEQIKRHYRMRVKEWHPDLCAKNEQVCKEMTQKIHDAYSELMDYCRKFPFPLSEEKVENTLSPEEWWRKRFGNDPLW